MTGCRFVLEIRLDDTTMRDQHDVAATLRDVAQRLNRFMSTDWGPYALKGKIHDRGGRLVGEWEVKGPCEDQLNVEASHVARDE